MATKMQSPKNKNDKIFIKTAWHKKLYKLGVPHHFWRENLTTQVGFKQTQFQGEKFSAALQRRWFKTLTTETRRNNHLILLSSEPTDTGALVAAYSILFSLLKKRYATTLINTGEEVRYARSYPFCVLLYNILSTATEDRLEKTRDLCFRFQHSFRMVVVAGAADPESWCRTKLGLTPTLVFRTKDISLQSV